MRRKLAIPAEKLNHAEADFRKQFKSPDQYQQYLQTEMHGSEQKLRQQMRRSLLIEQVLKTDVELRSTVSPAELQAYYEKNPGRFQQAETFTFQSISVLPPLKPTAGSGKGSTEESRGRAAPGQSDEELHGFRIAGGKTFRRRFPREHGRPQSRCQ